MKRQVHSIVKTLIYVIAMALCIIGGLTLIRGSVFRVHTVYISGTPEIFPDLNLFKKPEQIFFLSTKKLQEDILINYPLVKSVTISKQLPDVLKIAITEREPVALAKQGEKRLYIDETGKLLPEIQRFTLQNWPQLLCNVTVDSRGFITDQGVLLGLGVINDLKTASQVNIGQLNCIGEKEVLLLQLDGIEVKFSSNQSRSEVSAALLFLFKQFRIEGRWPRSIDLRFEKPVLTP